MSSATLLRILAVTVFPLFLLSCSGVASAHVLQANNGISAVLHIPPDDNPLAGQTTSLDFDFSSDSGRFTLSDCDCNAIVQTNGKTIQTIKLRREPSGGQNARAEVTFPQIGIYEVIVTGNSKKAAFKSFKLQYVERVATSATTVASSNGNTVSTVLLLSSASFVLLSMIGYAAISRGGRYARPL